MTAKDLRHLSIEATTNLICADSGSCSNPDDCRRFAADYVTKANELLHDHEVTVETVRLGKVTAFTVTDTGRIRVWTANGGTDLIYGDEVIPW
ncbi:hypothetical protein AB0F72_08630 [Actinoplanes sp. NPDC023936]|uniref:hypothetical protein n=1 Tax=Actinoplanes sp. NPDC023936 TaxID=3154910 RepID=UPI0033C339F8